MDTAQHLHKASVRIDQRLRVGSKIIVVPTDIDDHSMRCVVRGEKVGGPLDGETVHEEGELAIGHNLVIGDQISIILLGTEKGIAHFGITCPLQFVVYVE
jgi:hypothetical protein